MPSKPPHPAAIVLAYAWKGATRMAAVGVCISCVLGAMQIVGWGLIPLLYFWVPVGFVGGGTLGAIIGALLGLERLWERAAERRQTHERDERW